VCGCATSLISHRRCMQGLCRSLTRGALRDAGNPFPVWFCASRQSRRALGVTRPYPAALVPNGFQRSRKPALDTGLRQPLLQPLCHQCFPRQLPQICAGVAFPRCAQRIFCVADGLEVSGSACSRPDSTRLCDAHPQSTTRSRRRVLASHAALLLGVSFMATP